MRMSELVNCAGCGFDSPPHFAFCPRCGRKLTAHCPACGTATLPEFAFCPGCGSALSDVKSAPQAARSGNSDGSLDQPISDRRIVTVLFADLSGFTALSERLDPEEV